MMTRLPVFVLILSLVGTTPALAAEPLFQSAMRAAQALARTQASAAAEAQEGKGLRTHSSVGRVSSTQTSQAQPGLESSGLRKRTKILIAIGAAVGYATVAYGIDRHVVNNTPSSLGSRKD